MGIHYFNNATQLFTTTPLPPGVGVSAMTRIMPAAADIDASLCAIELANTLENDDAWNITTNGAPPNNWLLYMGSGSSLFPSGGPLIQAGQWYTLAFTLNAAGTGVSFFVNGVLIVQGTTTAGGVTPGRFGIGGGGGASTNHGATLGGSHADTRVWSRELSHAEMFAEMEADEPVRWSDLFSYYPMNNADNAAQDYSGNNNTLGFTVFGGNGYGDAQSPMASTRSYPLADWMPYGDFPPALTGAGAAASPGALGNSRSVLIFG